MSNDGIILKNTASAIKYHNTKMLSNTKYGCMETKNYKCSTKGQ